MDTCCEETEGGVRGGRGREGDEWGAAVTDGLRDATTGRQRPEGSASKRLGPGV